MRMWPEIRYDASASMVLKLPYCCIIFIIFVCTRFACTKDPVTD
jgi:hypothetical protein